MVLNKREGELLHRKIKDRTVFKNVFFWWVPQNTRKDDGWWGVDVEKLLVDIHLNNLMNSTLRDEMKDPSWKPSIFNNKVKLRGIDALNKSCEKLKDD